MKIIDYKSDSYLKHQRIKYGKVVQHVAIILFALPIIGLLIIVPFSKSKTILGSCIAIILFVVYVNVDNKLEKHGEKVIDKWKTWKRGEDGEEKVLRYLTQHFDDNWVYIDNFIVPGLKINTGDIDGILIGPRGVFVLEIKRWRGYFTVSQDGSLYFSKNGKKVPCDKNPIRQVNGNAEIFTEYLENKKEITIKPIPILVIVEGRLGYFANYPKVDVVELDQLERAINHVDSQNLSQEFIQKLINVLINKQCPRCNGYLVNRHKAGYPDFLGCSNYPSCIFKEELL